RRGHGWGAGRGGPAAEAVALAGGAERGPAAVGGRPPVDGGDGAAPALPSVDVDAGGRRRRPRPVRAARRAGLTSSPRRAAPAGSVPVTAAPTACATAPACAWSVPPASSARSAGSPG